MDFAVLNEHFELLIMVACLITGYIVKHATFLKWIPNDDIPVFLAVFGAFFNAFHSGFSLETIVYGALTGLASTGLHQAFKRWIEGSNTVAQ